VRQPAPASSDDAGSSNPDSAPRPSRAQQAARSMLS
jgi:hypothetical protein